jgi:hypothetical protein
MSRATRKPVSPTALQQIVDTGLMFAPPPVRKIASTSLGSKLLLIAMVALLAKGVLSIEWQDGMPKLNVDREKAAELKQKIAADLVERRSQLGHLASEYQSHSNPGREPWVSPPVPPVNYYQQPSSPYPQAAAPYPQPSSQFPQGAVPYPPGNPAYPNQTFPAQGYPPSYGQPYSPNYGQPYPSGYRRY